MTPNRDVGLLVIGAVFLLFVCVSVFVIVRLVILPILGSAS